MIISYKQNKNILFVISNNTMPSYYVSTNSGSDTNPGTSETSAFRTIQRATKAALSGDTIYVKYGIYRERVVPQTSNVSYIGISDPVTGLKPVIRGSCPWFPSNHTEHPDIWSGILHDNLFTDKSLIDGANPFAIPSVVTPYGVNGLPEFNMKEKMTPAPDPGISYCIGQVFINDKMIRQYGKRTDMISYTNSWWYDASQNTLYIHFSPEHSANIADVSIEITNQRRLFAPHIRGLKNITVNNFVFERCGNNYPNQFWLYPANQQQGMVGTRSGKNWTITNNIIQYANGVGIDFGNEGSSTQDCELGSNGLAQGAYGHTIINNVITENGAAGTASYMCKSFVFQKNTVTRNNNLQFYGKRRWESAGVKLHNPTSAFISDNIITGNYCHGIWCDQGSGTNSRIKNNILVNNLGSGINFEIGANMSGVVTCNVFDKNINGVSFVTSGGVCVSNNLFLSSIQSDIVTIIYTRTSDKWDSNNIRIVSNTFMNSPIYMQLTPTNPSVPASRFINLNTYFCDEKEAKFQSNGQSFNLEEWREYWGCFNNTDYDEKSVLQAQIMDLPRYLECSGEFLFYLDYLNNVTE